MKSSTFGLGITLPFPFIQQCKDDRHSGNNTESHFSITCDVEPEIALPGLSKVSTLYLFLQNPGQHSKFNHWGTFSQSQVSTEAEVEWDVSF